MDLIAMAKAEGAESVETTPEIIAHYNRRGLGVNPLTGKPNEMFIFQGIKVYPIGRTEAIEEEMNTPMGERLFGKDEGKVEGRT